MAVMKVDTKTVRDFLSHGNTLLIPQYQRAYQWEIDHCETLWDDIIDFFKNSTNRDDNNDDDDNYFLGSIVCFISSKNTLEIIDGQQRLTTLSLLFRALYAKLSDPTEQNDNIKGYLTSFGKCIWGYDEGAAKLLFNEIHLKSDIILDSDKHILNKILSENCDLDKDVKSKYAVNFKFFKDKIDDFVKKEYPSFSDFCKIVLDKLIILPIECNDRDNAMRIFVTLNNRGLSLNNSDIIKGIMYSGIKNNADKEGFANKWKELEAKIDKHGSRNHKMDFFFTQYMHVIRARNKIKSKEIGLVKFFTNNKKTMSNTDIVTKEIEELISLWTGDYDDKFSQTALQYFDVLNYYPNFYGSILFSTFYIYCKDKGKKNMIFNDDFLLPNFRVMLSNLLVKFIDTNAVNSIKPIVFNAYTNLYKDGRLNFDSNIEKILEDENLFKKNIISSKKAIPSLLRLYMYIKYPYQEAGLDAQIEHIFPKKSKKDKNKAGLGGDTGEELIESIGNKVLLEDKLNRKANNKYFDDKKEHYEKSQFEDIKSICNTIEKEWGAEEIKKRNEDISETLIKFFNDNRIVM